MFNLLKKSKRRYLVVFIVEALLFAILVVTRMISNNPDSFFESDTFVFIVSGVMLLFPAYAVTYSNILFERGLRKNYVKISNVLSDEFYEAIEFGQIGFLIYNGNKEIVWTNDLFDERDYKILGVNLLDFIPEAKKFFNEGVNSKASILFNSKNRIYEVIHIYELSLLIFKDVTELENLKEFSNENKPVVATILLDNLENVIELSNDDQYIKIESDIRNTIIDYAKEHNILIKKIKDDSYICILNELIYSGLLKDKFSLVDKVKQVSKDADLVLTISIGFGRGTNDYTKLCELANDSMGVAQSRGGCQVVVSNFAGNMEFFGVGVENTLSSNLIKNRSMAESLSSLIKNSNKVLIIPHVDADFDAIGAALGIQSICSTYNIESYIVANEKQIENKTKYMTKDLFDFNERFIAPNKSISLLDKNTLVVVVDVNKPSITTCPELLEKCENIVLIDHHRRTDDSIDNLSFSIIDNKSSSTCEIVSTLISNCPIKVAVNEKVSTFMYTGILLDTRGFKVRTNANTFRAAMILKNYGADGKVAESYMQDEFEEFELQNKILSKVTTPIFGVALAKIDDELVEKGTLAKAAESLVAIKDIKVGIAIGMLDKKTVGVSSRSDGSVNVALLMEKIGGGGHFNAGASQIVDKSIDEVIKEIDQLLEENKEEIIQKGGF